jgi:type II secretion system protein D
VPAVPAPAAPAAAAEEIQVSFQGANVDVIVKWLAEVTGKSITKHKGVACQLTILSPRRLPPREALQLVYRALALEGFSVVETRTAIVIVPEGMESKLPPEIAAESPGAPLEGKQVLVRFFRLKHLDADVLKGRVSAVLSEKRKLETDEHGKLLIVTDYAENLQLLADLIAELDRPDDGARETEIVPLRYLQADDAAAVLNTVFGAERKSGSGAERQPAVRVLADKVRNRLVITALLERMAEVKAFLASLDAEKPADLAVRLLPVEQGSPRDLAAQLVPLYQKIRPPVAGEVVEVIPSPRSSSLIVLSSEAAFQSIRDLAATLEGDMAAAPDLLTEILPLRHAASADVATLVSGVFAARYPSDVPGIRLTPDTPQNRIIITGTRARIDEVKALVATLDAEKPADLAVRVVPLQHGNARDLALQILPLYQKLRGPAVGEVVEIAASSRANSLIVLSSEASFQKIKDLVDTLERDMASGGNRATEVFALEHVEADEIADLLTDVFTTRNPADAGIRILPDRPQNRLVATASPERMAEVRELVRTLDVEKPADLAVRVIPLQRIAAGDLVGELGPLYEELRGPLLTEIVQIAANSRSNALLVLSSESNFKVVKELVEILELDMAAAEDRAIEVLQLKHVQADDVELLLGGVFGTEERRRGSSPAAEKKTAVRIFADRPQNRVVIVAPRERMDELKALVATLDVERPADMAVRVIALKHVGAKQLVEEVGPIYEKLQGPLLKEIVEVAANSRSNSLIVLSSESNYKAILEVVKALDTEGAQEKDMKAYVLKNADAEDVADKLTELYNDQDDYGGYYYYSYRRGRSEDGTEVRFVADRRRNAVIVIGPPLGLGKIAEMISALDEPIEGEDLVPKIYPLKFVSALDVEQVLNELFMRRRERRSYWYDDGGGMEDDRDVGRLYGKIRIASEPYTNAIIVTCNSLENFAAVETILKQLDVPSQAGGSTLYVQLKYANAVTIANNINILFAQPGSPARRAPQEQPRPQQGGQQQQQPGTLPAFSGFEIEEEALEESYFPWLGGGQQDGSRAGAGRTTLRPVSDLVGKVRVVPDIRTNSLMVTSNMHFFPEVLKVVEDLDIPTAQVLIEAKIIEVSLDARQRLGVRWSPDGSQVFDQEDLDDSIIVDTQTTYREVFAGSVAADAMRTGIVDATINLDFLIQFLQKRTDARVRAEPRINVADNERGKLFVGSRVPFISNSLITDTGGKSDSFEYIDVGITLEVTPHINNRNQVDLKVRVEASQIRPGETLFGGAIIDTRNYRTDLTVENQQTLVLGGIIQREESEVERKIPILGDIPFLRWLFKKTDTVARDIELMVFLRPTVTQSPEDVRALMEAEERKTPEIRRWERVLEEERAVREAEEAEEEAKREAEAEAPR